MRPVTDYTAVRICFHAVLCLYIETWTGSTYAQSTLPEAGKYGLMIGITSYDHASMNGDRPLKFPEDDARAVGKFLQDHGYQIDYLLGAQATREAILKTLKGLSSKANASGVCVVGLFGHGVEVELMDQQNQKEVRGCFCPFDTALREVINADGQVEFLSNKVPKVEPKPDSLVMMSDVVIALAQAKAGSRLLIADCCRKMPHRVRSRNLGLGANFSTDRLPGQTVMLFGCRPGEEALESDEWEHGAFTKSLLEVLTQMSGSAEPVTTGTLADRVKLKVQTLTGGKQNPAPISIDSIDLKLERPVPAELVNSLGASLILTRPGRFLMGSNDSELERASDETQRLVEITKPFYVGKNEVTQEEYLRVMQYNPSTFTGSPHLPVESVTWFDAVQFCNSLSDLERRPRCYRIGGVQKEGKNITAAEVELISGARGYRLPTEAEWEYACRAGSDSPFNAGSSLTPLQANFNGSYPYANGTKGTFRERTIEVDKLTPNAWGLFHMHGNVWEWCQDWYGEYDGTQPTDPIGPLKGAQRVYRGGSWNSYGTQCRSAYRFRGAPEFRFQNLGFRLVLVP